MTGKPVPPADPPGQGRTALPAGPGNPASGREIACARTPPRYVGRFAPSPTGALHLGSLVTAVGSFLDARHHGGRWLVRIEDLDTARTLPGCSDDILRTLERFGLRWDGSVEYQSARTERYAAALESLQSHGRTYLCSCSRRELDHTAASGYPGTCRNGARGPGPFATRFRIDDQQVVRFADLLQGSCEFRLASLGDVVIRRRDDVFAYQLAVVVDDAAQGITHVIRGADLLESTAWQIELGRALSLAAPQFGHLPLVLEPAHGKLSKSRRSLAVGGDPTPQLIAALQLLQHPPPAGLERAAPRELLDWAIGAWRPQQRLRTLRELIASP